MTEQECLGIDCAWCADPNCPRERKNMETKELEQKKTEENELYWYNERKDY